MQFESHRDGPEGSSWAGAGEVGQVGRGSLVALAGLVALADLLFLDQAPGLSLAVLAVALVAAVRLVGEPRRLGRGDLLTAVLLVPAVLPVVEMVQGLSLLVLGLGIVAAAVRVALGDGGTPKALPRAVARFLGRFPVLAVGRVLAMARHLQAREATVRSFTDHVTHELKTPLAAIRGAAEILGEARGLEAQDRRLVASVGAAAGRMDRLLSELRRLAVLRAGDFRGRARLDEAVAALRPERPGLTVETEGGAVALPLSREGLGIVLGQLLGNAAEAGATRVRLSAARREGGAELLVAANGSGIEPGDCGRVFEPFFTTRREAGGTGMGLYIVRTLLEAQGAGIRLEERAGGAAFRLDFPE